MHNTNLEDVGQSLSLASCCNKRHGEHKKREAATCEMWQDALQKMLLKCTVVIDLNNNTTKCNIAAYYHQLWHVVYNCMVCTAVQ